MTFEWFLLFLANSTEYSQLYAMRMYALCFHKRQDSLLLPLWPHLLVSVLAFQGYLLLWEEWTIDFIFSSLLCQKLKKDVSTLSELISLPECSKGSMHASFDVSTGRHALDELVDQWDTVIPSICDVGWLNGQALQVWGQWDCGSRHIPEWFQALCPLGSSVTQQKCLLSDATKHMSSPVSTPTWWGDAWWTLPKGVKHFFSPHKHCIQAWEVQQYRKRRRIIFFFKKPSFSQSTLVTGVLSLLQVHCCLLCRSLLSTLIP